MGSTSSRPAATAASKLASHAHSHANGVGQHAGRMCYDVIHRHCSCETWWLHCAMAGFISGLKIYAPLFLITTTLKNRFQPSPREILTRTLPAALTSSLFLSMNSGLFPLLTCIYSRRGNPHSRLSSFWLAAIGAFVSILIEAPSRRGELALFVAGQAGEFTYRSLISRGLAPNITHGLDILYCLSFATLVYYSIHFPEKVQGSAKVLLNVFVGTEDDPDTVEKFSHKIYVGLKSWLQPRLPWLYSDTHEKSRICKHRSGCKSYTTIGFIKAFLIALTIRSVFTFLPAFFLLGPTKFVYNLRSLLRKAFGKSGMMLALFFGCMNAGTRGAQCFLRWIRGEDDGLNSWLAGLVGSLSVVFFSNPDFAIYIASKAIETGVMTGAAQGYLPSIPGFQVLLYSISTAALFYGASYEPHHLRLSYWSFLFKTSRGHWAKFFLSFSPVRHEAGVPGLALYKEWMENFCSKLLPKYVSSKTYDNLFANHIHPNLA